MERVRVVQQIEERTVIRHMKAFDAQPHLLDLEAAPVDFAAIVQCAPDQRLADPCLAAGHVLVRPGAAFDQVEIDVAVMPVGIEVGARPARGEQRNAAIR